MAAAAKEAALERARVHEQQRFGQQRIEQVRAHGCSRRCGASCEHPTCPPPSQLRIDEEELAHERELAEERRRRFDAEAQAAALGRQAARREVEAEAAASRQAAASRAEVEAEAEARVRAAQAAKMVAEAEVTEVTKGAAARISMAQRARLAAEKTAEEQRRQVSALAVRAAPALAQPGRASKAVLGWCRTANACGSHSATPTCALTPLSPHPTLVCHSPPGTRTRPQVS